MSCLRSRIVNAVTSTSCGMALAAAEVAANGTDIYVYLLSWQTAIPSTKLQFVFGLLLTVLFGRIQITLFGPLFGPNRIFGTVQL